MLKFGIVVLAAVLALGNPPAGDADTFSLHKCTVTLPVVYQTTDNHGLQVLKTLTLKSNDLVNLALGRPLSTKLDAATEVLAFASDVTTPGAGSKLVVFNPATQQITTTIFETSNFVLLSNETFSQNVAFSDVTFQETVLGDSVHDALLETTVAMSGSGKSSGSFATTSVAGPVSFTFTDGGVTTTIQGLVAKGKLKASGPQLALL